MINKLKAKKRRRTRRRVEIERITKAIRLVQKAKQAKREA
jgi:hypothetical protein